MAEKTFNFKQALGFAGAFIAFMMGSGFATGQEVLQYFASYGYKGILGVFVCFLLLLYASVCYITVGYREKFEKSSAIFTYYCGKKIGSFFDYFTVAAIYLCFAVMLAGAGATVHQHYGLPSWTGAVLIGVLTCGTVMKGLGKIVDVIGKIGPVIIVIAIFLAIASIVRGLPNLSLANEVTAKADAMRASSNWLFSALSYIGISLVWLASFLTALGAKADGLKEAHLGAVLGSVSFCSAILLTTLGVLANWKDVVGAMIPNLVLANNLSSALGTVFSVIIVVGIYTAAVPLLWTVAARITAEGTRKFQRVSVVLSAIGLAIGLSLPFNTLVNIIYVAIGNIGFVLFLFMLVKNFKGRLSSAHVLIQ